MASIQAPLFDADTQKLRAARARRRQAASRPFLLERTLEDLTERVQDVNRTFSNVRLIGPYDFREDIQSALPAAKRFERFSYSKHSQNEDSADSHDLVLSLLDLQSVDDLPAWMRAMRQSLTPDGLFIAAFLGGATLGALRQAFYALDTDALGSPAPRIHPLIDVRQAAPLLSHVGLALPVIDTDRFTVHYRALGTLLGDLRDLGLTNVMAQRSKAYLGRAALVKLEDALRPSPSAPLPIEWEIVWMTGWAPHESQQKPLKPGSAKTALNAALRAIRDEGD